MSRATSFPTRFHVRPASRATPFPTRFHVRPAKNQFSMCGPSLSARRHFAALATYRVPGEDSEQTAQMRSLI